MKTRTSRKFKFPSNIKTFLAHRLFLLCLMWCLVLARAQESGEESTEVFGDKRTPRSGLTCGSDSNNYQRCPAGRCWQFRGCFNGTNSEQCLTELCDVDRYGCTRPSLCDGHCDDYFNNMQQCIITSVFNSDGIPGLNCITQLCPDPQNIGY